ncbi:MAG TPA: hypothetical protein VLC30_08775 [Pseudomonas sp.]|nr:hypothetical protein [Pseudomonas sp.]
MQRLLVMALLLAIAGCSLQPPAPVVSSRPGAGQNHPHFAPPPGGNSYWDAKLGVYVLKGGELYYRERTYYRWNQGWAWSSSPQGPWQATDSSGVPPGLGRKHAQ